MSKDLMPVPKVWASTAGALIASITIAALVRFGWTDQQAAMIAPGVVNAVLVIGPALIVFLFGYATPDGDRARLQQERDEAKEIIEYLKANANERTD